MPTNKAQSSAPSKTVSLDSLVALLADDMRAVNAMVMKRLSSDVPLIPELAGHLIAAGGKRIRPMMTLAGAKITRETGPKKEAIIGLATAVEFIHTATLLHDDVIDESNLRRGIKTTNKIWGNQSSILVGDYLLSRCFEIMVEDGDLEVLKLLSSTSAEIAQGEVLQLQHKGEADLLEETYLKIINLKTAALFSAATKTGGCIAGSNLKEKDALGSYGKNLGLAFQIVDDALDYSSRDVLFGKELGKDFYEGKTTLPIIILYQRALGNERDFLVETFKKDKRTKDNFIETCKLIKKYNTVEESFKRAEYFVSVSRDALGIFEESNEKKILQNLTTFSLNRKF